MAVRVSLGAGRFRLVRQVMTESLLLSVAGSLLGIWLAYFGADALVRILSSGRQRPGMPSHLDIPIRPDAHVLLFAVGIALFTGLLFRLAPAVRAWLTAPMSSLRDVGKATGTRFHRFFGKTLVAAQ